MVVHNSHLPQTGYTHIFKEGIVLLIIPNKDGTKANYYYQLRRVRKACLEQFPEETAARQVIRTPVTGQIYGCMISGFDECLYEEYPEKGILILPRTHSEAWSL